VTRVASGSVINQDFEPLVEIDGYRLGHLDLQEVFFVR